MAMTTMVTGKMYNGKAHDWKDKKKNDRSMFRGRLNYRDRTTGEWHFVDAVCWKDFGDTQGLVGFLEKHFSQDSDGSPTDKGGQPIELVGYFEPTTKKKQVEIKGKTKTIKVDVEYDTFQFVIETVDFPPNNEKRAKKDANVVDEDDFDFDEDEEFEVVGQNSDDEEIEDEDDEDDEEVVETAKERTARLKAEKLAKAKADKAKAARAAKAKADKEAEEEDDEFFTK